MIYRVTLPNGETVHTGYGPLADVWLNRHGGKLERIPLSNIPRPADEMWDGSALSAAIISVDRLRAILGDTNRRENALWNEIAAWRSAFVKRNGLAYDQDRDAIVHMDTGREYLPAREYKTQDAVSENDRIFPDIDERFASRLALMLECLIVDYHGHWNEACALLDEYKAEWEKVNPSPPTFMGEPMPTERRERLMKMKADRAENAQKSRTDYADCHGPDWTDRDGEYLK